MTELYGLEVSPDLISTITDEVMVISAPMTGTNPIAAIEPA